MREDASASQSAPAPTNGTYVASQTRDWVTKRYDVHDPALPRQITALTADRAVESGRVRPRHSAARHRNAGTASPIVLGVLDLNECRGPDERDLKLTTTWEATKTIE
jgi:hypothetical protein